MIPAFEREKTVHALDGAATVIGIILVMYQKRLFPGGELQLPGNSVSSKNISMFQYAKRVHPAIHGHHYCACASYPCTLHALL
jgi:hypothetical protein